MADDITNLEEAALKRKERLLALKRRHCASKSNGDGEESTEKLPKPVFRSYVPQNEELKELQLPRATPGNVEEKIKDQLDAGTPAPVIDEVDLINLAPRKPDWDLKRDVAKKLAKLERRTQKAIAELIRERLKQGQENLVVAVNAATKVSQNSAESDED